MGNETTTYVHLKNKLAAITPTDWDYDFNPDEILRIDPYNIFAEVITIPVLVNRMGVFVAQMRSYVKRKKLDLEVKEAEVRKLFRQKAEKKPTVQETEDHLAMDGAVRAAKLELIKLQEDLERLESYYESSKDKSFKLNNLSKHLSPEEFDKEIIEGAINGVFIKLKEKRVKTQ